MIVRVAVEELIRYPVPKLPQEKRPFWTKGFVGSSAYDIRQQLSWGSEAMQRSSTDRFCAYQMGGKPLKPLGVNQDMVCYPPQRGQVSGSKNHALNWFWNQKPQILGAWTLWARWLH